MNDIVIIPGFLGDEKHEISRNFNARLGKKCHIFVPTWKYHALNYWVKEYEDFIKRKKLTNFTVFGFSMGALVAAHSNVQANKTIYGSMTPLFPGFVKYVPKRARKWLGKKRMAQLAIYKHKPNSVFMVGEKEMVSMHKVVERFGKGSKIIVVKGADHDLADPLYFEPVIEEIKKG